MITKVVPGMLIAANDAAGLAAEASSRIARSLRQAIAKGSRASIALSGGNTPRGAYTLLAREQGIDWNRVNVFWVDERAVPPTDDRSNYKWAKATLLDGAGVAAAQIHRMPADAPDLNAAATAYEKTFRQHVELDGDGVPAFDVAVMGMGDDGHTASLFPGSPCIDVHDKLVTAVPAAPGREARLTLTVTAIEHIRNVFMLIEGAAKLPAIERAWAAKGDVHETPVRVVRGCRGAVTWVIDKAAGGLGE